MRSSIPVLLALALAAPLLGQTALPLQEQPRTISVTGTATVRAIPDRIKLQVGVETFDPSLDVAVATARKRGEAILAALGRLGITGRDIQTEALDVTLHYKDGSRPSRGIDGYYARRSYEVTLHDRALVERVFTDAINSGANSISEVSYAVEDLRKYRDEARKLAAQAAVQKAKLIAGELGASVGAVRSISEQNRDTPAWWGRYGGGGANQNVAVSSGSGEATSPAGEVEITCEVYATFDLK